MTSLLATWLVALTHALCCTADYTLVQTFHSYLNPRHTRSTGVCCESQGMPPCPTNTLCDNIFTICAPGPLHGGQTPDGMEDISPADCPLGHYISQTFRDDDNITSDPFLSVTFSGDIWPGSLQLVIQVYDEDIGNPDDFVDVLVLDLSLSPSSSPPLPFTHTSSSGVFSIVISFQLECTQSFYGDACDMFCEPRDDDSHGHYSCDSDGEKACLQGYQLPASNCTACIPASGCMNGSCALPGECTCHEGFEGELCTPKMQQSHDNHVTYIVVGVVVGMTVVIVVAMMMVVLRILWLISGKPASNIPGDSPLYMSAADLTAVHNSSPPHSTAAGHSPLHIGHSSLHSTAGEYLEPLAIPDLVVSIEGEEEGEEGEGDNTCSSSNTHSTTRGNLDPYGNYGDKTIAKVAGVAPPSPLFDDSKYVEWLPPQTAPDTDDVDSDCQSEYL